MKWNTLKPIVVLTVICLVVSAALVGTYSLTKPVIDAAKAEQANAALTAVLPEGKDFEQVECDVENVVTAYQESNGAGYVFQAQGKGFGGMITVMVGIGPDGTITGTQVMDHSETAGIGTQIEQESFQQQYIGKDYTLEGVETITGATFSSKGFNYAINAAYEGYGVLAGVDTSVTKEIVYPDAELVASMLGEDYILMEVEGTDCVYASAKGYAFNMTASGFAGDIHVLVAIDPNGAIIASKMFQHSETDDYGAKLAKDSYGEKWIGLTASDEFPMKSGATVTSNAYKECVTNAFAAYDAAVAKFEQLGTMLPGALTAVDTTELEDAVKAAYSSENGYLFDVAGEGFGGEIKLLVAIDNNDAILSVKMYQHTETDDYGAKLAKDSYGEKWVGLTSSDELPMKSGATVTSNAYKGAVEAAFNAYQAVKGA